jgi:hypothetical protein
MGTKINCHFIQSIFFAFASNLCSSSKSCAKTYSHKISPFHEHRIYFQRENEPRGLRCRFCRHVNDPFGLLITRCRLIGGCRRRLSGRFADIGIPVVHHVCVSAEIFIVIEARGVRTRCASLVNLYIIRYVLRVMSHGN